jgi:hypothetical protein
MVNLALLEGTKFSITIRDKVLNAIPHHQLSCKTTPDLHENPVARLTRRNQIKDSNSYAPPEYDGSNLKPKVTNFIQKF